MKKAVLLVARLSLASLLLIFGLNGLFHFIPVPASPEPAERFRNALEATGYMLPLWKGIEFLGASLLLLNRAVPFALVILAPVLVNIFLFHWFLAPQGLPLAAALLALEGLLAWNHRDRFQNLFSQK